MPATSTSFEPGNRAAVKHGAFAPRVFGPIAEAMRDGLLEQRPHLCTYRAAVAAWADAEARCQVLREHLEQHGMLDDRGRPRPAVELLLRLERQADRARQRLGLDPRSDAQLARETAEATSSVADLDAVRAAGREALRRAEGVEVVEVEVGDA